MTQVPDAEVLTAAMRQELPSGPPDKYQDKTDRELPVIRLVPPSG